MIAAEVEHKTTGLKARIRIPEPEELNPYFPHLQVVSRLGVGGMGVVYQALQMSLGRNVALKILPPSMTENEAMVKRFNKEAKILAQIQHRNVVSVFDYGDVAGTPYFIMEYVYGHTVYDLMCAGLIDLNGVISIIASVASGLKHIHAKGVAHHDINPNNVMVSSEGVVKLLDFGLASMVGPGSGVTAKRMGTQGYAAPERYLEPDTVDHRADLYSLGVLFYHLLTAKLPVGSFARPSEISVAEPKWDELILRCLEERPERRYQDAESFLVDMQRIYHNRRPVSTSVYGKGPRALKIPDLPRPRRMFA